MDINANLNNTECLVRRSHFGYDTFINICSGKHIDIPWALNNWGTFTFGCFLAVVFLLVLLSIIGIIIAVVKDSY